MNTQIISNWRVGVKTLSASPTAPYEAPYDPFDLAHLAERGCHFVLCGHGKRPLGPWLTPPPFGAVLGHVARGEGLVGWRPDSLGLTCLDVDKLTGADLQDFVSKWPPFVALTTPRGAHLAYRDDAPRANAKWAARGLAGDVRGARGYAVLWPGQERRLADAFDFPRLAAVPAQDLVDQLQIPLFDVREYADSQGGGAGPAPDRPAEGWRFAPSTARLAARHDRHNALLENVLCALGRAPDMRGQLGAILALTRRYNRALPEPLADAETIRVSRYFAKYSADWEGRPHTPRFLARQRRKGLRSGLVRQRMVWERNVAIRVARAEGVTLKDLTAVYGLSRSQVHRVLQTPPHTL